MEKNAALDGQYDCIVVGGGVVGTAIALGLQARGRSTLLLDPEPERRGASWGNAGHIATEQVEPLASMKALRSAPGRLFSRGGALALPPRDMAAWLPFALRMVAASRPAQFAAGKGALRQMLSGAIPAWRSLLEIASARDLLSEQGHYVVWERAVSAAAGRAGWAAADIGETSFRDATPDEQALLATLMSRSPAGVVRFSGSAQITDLGELAIRLGAAFAGQGGQQVQARVTRLMERGGRTCLELDSGHILSAEAIIVAAGAASGDLLRPLGHKAPIIAERGYHIQASAPDWPADMPPVVFEDRSMIVTRFRSALRAASFVEFSRTSSPPDPRKWRRLEDHVIDLGLPFSGPVSRWVGVRPTLPDYLPAIGRSEAAENLYYAFGHQHLGLTLAAVTGEAVAAMVEGDQTAFDLAPFSLTRFSRRH